MLSRVCFVLTFFLLLSSSVYADDFEDDYFEDYIIDRTPISIQEWRRMQSGENVDPQDNTDQSDSVDQSENPEPNEIDPIEKDPPNNVPDVPDIPDFSDPYADERVPLNEQTPDLTDFPSYDDLFSNVTPPPLPPVDERSVDKWTENPTDEVYQTDEEIAKALRKAEQERQKAIKSAPYKALFRDDQYVYLLNRQSANWKQVPYKSNEYMIDCWIFIVESDEQDIDDVALNMSQNRYSDKKYYMHHYLIRPAVQRIQVVSMLEVVGRAQNNVRDRVYDPSVWEPLIPTSIEDSIYQAVTAELGTKKANPKGHMTFWDHLDRDLNIAIK